MFYKLLSVVALLALCAGALSAQIIDVQDDQGAPLTNGQKVKLGKSSNGDIHNVTITVENLDTTDLEVTDIAAGGYNDVSINIVTPTLPQTLTTNQTFDIQIEIDPRKDSDWSFNLAITSDDTLGNDNFTLTFEGTQGDPDDDDDDCSTHEGGGLSWLMILALLSAGVVATRMRASRA